MATITTYLKMIDQFSKPLQRAIALTNAATVSMTGLKKAFQQPAKVKLDISNVRGQLASILKQAQSIKVKIDLDARAAMSKARALKQNLQKQLEGIQAKVKLKLQVSLSSMMSSLQRLVLLISSAALKLCKPNPTKCAKQSAASSNVPPASSNSTTRADQGNSADPKASKSKLAWFGNVAELAQKHFPLDAFKNMFVSSFNGAMGQVNMKDTMIALTGNEEIGTEMFNKFKSEALAAGVDVNKAIQGTISFFPATQNTDQLNQLNNFAARLSAFDPKGQGYESASNAVKEAMSGNTSALVSSYNLSGSDIESLNLDSLGGSGDIEGFIKAFDKLLQKQGMSQQAFETLMATPLKQLDKLKNSFHSAFADAGMSSVQALAPLFTMLNDAFEQGKFQPFFHDLSSAFTMIASIAAWAGQLIVDNLDIVRNALVAIGLVALAAGIKFLISWIMAAWPLFLIIGVITALITLLNYFGVSTSDIIGFVAGAFMVLFSYLWNSVAKIWNVLVSFAAFLANLFIDPIYAIQKLFYDLAMVFGMQLYHMLRAVESFAGGFTELIVGAINKVLKGFNKFSDAINILFDYDLGKMPLLDDKNPHAMSDSFKNLLDQIEEPTSSKNVLNFDNAKMDLMDYGDMYDKGFSFGSGAFNQLGNAFDGAFDFSDWNSKLPSTASSPSSSGSGSLGNIDKVGELGQINNTVDISNEDLKMMRELAEMKSIQNFVSVQPNLTFGDTHVRQDGRSIEEIVANITNRLNEEIATSAKGVFV